MKSIPHILTLLLSLSFGFLSAQVAFTHKAEATNTSGYITTLDNAATNGKPDMVLIVQQMYGVYNPHEISVWYNEGKWKIFNQDRQALPLNAQFQVLAVDPAQYKRAFVHTANVTNTRGHITYLNNVLTDNQPGEILFVTQRFGKYNTSPVGVWYTNGKWTIYNENQQAIPENTMFNVIVLKGGEVEGAGNYKGHSFTHTVSAANQNPSGVKYISYIRDSRLDGKTGAFIFTTNNYLNTYNTHTTGTWYSAPNWTVFNMDQTAIPVNQRLNVLSLEYSGMTILMTTPGVFTTPQVMTRPSDVQTTPVRTATDPPVRNVTKFETPVRTKVAIDPKIYNYAVLDNIREQPGRWVIAPYGKPTTPTNPTPDAPPSTEVQGPNVKLGKELQDLLGDPLLRPFVEKLNIFREVYGDINPNAGFFYYLPSAYTLNWNRENGEYSFFVYYLSANNAGRGDVIVTAELTPNISEQDIELAESLLSKKLRKDIKLYPMPLRNTPSVSFGNSLTLFNVDPASLTTNIPTDFLQPIVVSWKMNERVDDLLGYMMSRNQVAGNMAFEPFSEEEKVFSVPVQLKLNDAKTYGKLEYPNAGSLLNGFTNPLDYPIILTSISVMREAGGGTTVENVSLNNYEVKPQQIFSGFTAEEKNKVMNGALITKLWVNYTIKADCADCNEIIQDKILGGTSTSRVQKIEVEVLTPIAYSGAQSLKLLIQSRQGDPKGEQEVMLPIVTITQDGQTIKGGELFVSEGETPEYSYQLVIVKPDGDVQTSEWKEGSELFMVIGERTIKDLFETTSPAPSGGNE
ncbi:MAG: hypothetical protein SF052_21645 [Bacteroidia bacterium]|nr:hypothetical protein [Bacteroidia bacterium]